MRAKTSMLVRVGQKVELESVAFQLAENLDAAGTAEAYPLKWSTEHGSYSIDAAHPFDVTDAIGNCWGLVRDCGFATSMPSLDEGQIWVVTQNPGLPIYTGYLETPLSGSGTASVIVDNYGSVWVTACTALLDAGETLPQQTWVLIHYDVSAAQFRVLAAQGCPT